MGAVFQCLRCALVVAFLSIPLVAEAQDYSVTRSFSEQSLCLEGGTTSTTVQLIGTGDGDPGDQLTVTEILRPGPRGGSLEKLQITAGQGGTVESFTERVVQPVGVFDTRILMEHTAALGNNNNTFHEGGNTYTSITDAGRDIWAPGDTMEFAYNRFEGDFDVSVRIDDYQHATNDGCWGKYGIHARQSLQTTARMCQVSNHGPKGVAPGATGPCADDTQWTDFFGRRNDGDAADGGTNMFERHPPKFEGVATYLRLTRRGNTIRGWASDDSRVEDEPTDDSLWLKLGVPDGVPEPLDTTGSDDCWYVGFANSDQGGNDAQLQTVEFTLIRWEGDDCSMAPEQTAKKLSWNVPRSEVTTGLSYTIENSGGDLTTLKHAGEVVGGNSSVGPNVSHSETVSTRDVGDFTTRTLGASGSGVSTYDDASGVYSMTGGGEEIWNGGDSMNFLYTQMMGDFVATAHVLSRDWRGSDWGKYGLMARQSCHPDSRHEFMASNSSAGGTRHTERTDHIVPDPDTNREVYIADAGVVPGSPPGGTPPTPDNASPATNPDHYMLMRTGSQVTGYVAWDDPADPGEPFHWCLVGSTNHQDRFEDMWVGMAINAGPGTSGPVAAIDFTMDVQPYTVDAADNLTLSDAILLTLDFEAEFDGSAPNGAVIGNPSRGGGTFPRVQGGRLRMTEDGLTNSATAAYWSNPILADMIDNGFEAEFDVTASSSGEPGDGGTFVVIASGVDQLLGGGTEIPTPVGVFESRVLMEHEGLPALGTNNRTEYNGGNSYTSTVENGRDIWAPGDTMEFAYNRFQGDFDLSIRIDDYNHSTNDGCWGKYGIHARQTLETSSRMCQISNHGPKGVAPGATGPCEAHQQETAFFGRRNHLDLRNGGPNMFEMLGNEEGVEEVFPYLRLTRRGNTINGWASANSDIEGDPTNDALWIKMFPDFDTADGGLCWYVGFANSDQGGNGAQIQEVEFSTIKWDGTPATCPQGAQTTNFFGNAGAGLGFGGEVAPNGATPIRDRNECRPMFAIEFDTVTDESVDRVQFAGVNNEGSGSPDAPGTYHIGLDTNSSTSSRQINEQLGVAPGDLPNLFDPANPVHVRVQYRPNGQVQTWVSSGGSGGAAGQPSETLVIDTYIPPLSLGAGLEAPIVGFTASTGSRSQTLEFDNLTITEFVSGGGEGGRPVFRRADCDQSGKVDFNDAIFHLRFLFLGENEDIVNSCRDACDSDDSGADDFTDDINTLRVLFLGQGGIPAPGPLPDESHPCGVDPTLEGDDPETELTCETYQPVIACP